MTDFGDKMSNYLDSYMTNDVGERDVVVKKQKKTTIDREYTFEVSGDDAIMTYLVNGKEKMKLLLFMSRTNDEGLPICFIQEKGQNIQVDENSLASFLYGLSSSESYPSGEVDVIDKDGNRCKSVPTLYKSKLNGNSIFIRSFLLMLHNKKLYECVRKGLINMDIIFLSIDRGEHRSRSRYSYKTIKSPWFLNTGYSYYGIDFQDFRNAFTTTPVRIKDETKPEGYRIEERYTILLENNIHYKLFRAMMEKSMELSGRDWCTTLMDMYTDTSYSQKLSCKTITMELFKCFVILANRYDEPFAIKCAMDYMTNPKMDGLSTDVLNNILTLNVKAYCDGDRRADFGPYSGRHDTIRHSLFNSALTDEDLQQVVNFDKNRFWDYLSEASCVGKGRRLEGYIRDWADYIIGAASYYGKITDKYPEYLQVAHDIVVDKYVTYTEFCKEQELVNATELGEKYCEYKRDGWSLHIFRSVKEYLDEANYQGNCLESSHYADRTADGLCWIGSFRQTGSKVPYITVEIQPRTGQIVQVKGRYNHEVAEKDLATLRKIQDSIYKKMMADGYIDGAPGYHKCLVSSEL